MLSHRAAIVPVVEALSHLSKVLVQIANRKG
jgi:hypothetical protein